MAPAVTCALDHSRSTDHKKDFQTILSLKSGLVALVVSAAMLTTTCGEGGGDPKTTPPPSTFTISAAVSGLSAGTLVLQDNGGNNLTINASGMFSFTDPVKSGASYSVTILTQPAGETCTMGNNGSGIATANVTVTVACATTVTNYTISATVSGLTGTLVLQDNGSDNVTITANGTFPFATQIVGGSSYNVTVLTQPVGQTCTLGNGSSGTANANTTVMVTCAVNPTFSISAAVSGLAGTLVLLDNGADNLTFTADGTLPFATPIASGGGYSVTVVTQPSGQTCTPGSNSSGTANANVTVAITCVSNSVAVGVYTNKNDNFRSGQNLQETVLTPQNVNVNSFGKLFSYPVDGSVQSQPLYVPNVYVPNPQNGSAGTYNIVYFATANDTLYAYDADGKVLSPLWKVSFINPPGVVPVPGSCAVANVPIIGITPTPVIDPTTKTMYVEARTLENPTDTCTGAYVHRLHALDIATGEEKFGGPVEIQGSVPGIGEGTLNGVVAFDPMKENARPGLLLSQSAQDPNSVVYISTASNEDTQPYHGWVLGYDSQTLEQKYVFCTTPNGGLGGIWQMGAGLAADADGNIFVQTGNGTFDNTTDFGQSVLKLVPNALGLSLVDSYTPNNYDTLNGNDWDVSSGGLLLLPDQPGNYPHLMIGGGKEGTIYVLNRDNLGGYKADANNIVQYIVGAIKPSIAGQPTNGIWNTPSYFNGNVYIFGQNDYPKMFTLSNGLLPTAATSTGNVIMRGPVAMISANGAQNGIVWMLQYDTTPPALWAFNPANLTQEYYDTNQNQGRDRVALTPISRVNPTIANGRVYVPANNIVQVYGLLQ